MNEQDVREAFTRLVDDGPPPPGSTVALTAGRRARRRRTAATGLAAVAVVAAAVTVTGPTWRTPADPTAATPTPSPTVVLAPESPFTADRVAQVQPGCVRAAGLDPADYRIFAGQISIESFDGVEQPPDGDALLAGPGRSYAICTFSPEGSRTTIHEFADLGPAAVSVDYTRTGGTPSGFDPDDPLTGVLTVVAGRVAPDVRRIEVGIGEGTFPAPIYNDTFLFSASTPRGEVPEVVVRAYDGGGRLLGTAQR